MIASPNSISHEATETGDIAEQLREYSEQMWRGAAERNAMREAAKHVLAATAELRIAERLLLEAKDDHG